MDCSNDKTDCCCQSSPAVSDESFQNLDHCVIGKVQTVAGEVPKVSTTLKIKDILGSWKARWDIHRMNYKVAPGLYCVGNPDGESPVLISANYKMSFDVLRKELGGLDAWIVVLDTDGVNVWCSAGKGTFGTEELVRRLAAVNLPQIVSHRTIIAPQLGAPSVAAHEVFSLSGFQVVYGPVRASDLKAFIFAGLTATPAMRKVEFTLRDRLVLTPIELVGTIKPLAIIGVILVVLSFFGLDILSFAKLYPYIGAVVLGCVAVPALLPWIPGKAFSWKGWLAGAIWVAGVGVINSLYFPQLVTWRPMAAYFLTVPAISSFLALNFTGASTYTSLSGVEKEMRIALPAIACSFVLGIVVAAAGLFAGF